MAITQDVVVLNDLGGSSLSRRERESSTGTAVRYSIEFKADPILHDFNQERLGQGPALAILALLQRKMREISALASDATAAKRANSVVGLAAGNPSDVRRYSGGRMGTKPPKNEQPSRLFNDSGRFADGLNVRFNPTDNNFTINVPANRLDPRTFGGAEAALVSMWRKLVELVPEFKGGAEVLKDEGVRTAIAEAVSESIVTRTDKARSTISRARAQLFGAVLRDLGKIVQLGV